MGNQKRSGRHGTQLVACRALASAAAASLGLALMSSALAFDPEIWVHQFGTSAQDSAQAIAIDGEGSLLVTGRSTGDLAGKNTGGFDTWLVKTDLEGAVIWKTQIDEDSPDAIAVDGKGNVFVCGFVVTDDDQLDAWVAKWTSKGALSWKQHLGTQLSEHCNAVAVDGAGNVYIAGDTDGDLANPGQGEADGFVAKYDRNGGLIWSVQMGTAAYDAFRGVAIDGGDVLVAGYTLGSPGTPSKGSADVWLVKIDSGGSLIWQRQYGTPAADVAFAMTTDGFGNVFVAGQTDGSFGRPNQGRTDAWLGKFRSDGRRLWSRQLGSKSYDWALGIAADVDGSVVMTGVTGGAIVKGQRHGDRDGWAAKYDRDGKRLKRWQVGTEAWDDSLGVAIDVRGDIYLTGFTYGDFGALNLGLNDAWVLKLSGAMPLNED